MEFLRMATTIDYPVEGYPGRAASCNNLQLHFMYQHMEDNILVLYEVPGTRPQCKYCDMLIP